MRRRWIKLLLGALAAILAIPLLYFTAVLIGALIPANAGWREPQDGVHLLIRTNGVHTWIMVPLVTAEMDWRPLVPAADMKDPRYFGNYVAIGYGNREFYLNTPHWADLKLKTAWAAMFGSGPSLIHADHDYDPKPDPYQFPLTVTHQQYARLAKFMVASFDLDAGGRSKPLRGRGYGPSDVFYEARGSYNGFRTCNEWTGEALRYAGVRTGIWTPLAPSITWRLK